MADVEKNKAVLVKTLENIYVCDIESLSAQKRRPLKVLGEWFGNYYVGFVLQRNSPYTVIFNKYLQLFAQHDLLKYSYKISIKEIKAQQILFQTYLQEEKALINLSKLQGGLYFLGFAHITSFLVLLLEICYERWH